LAPACGPGQQPITDADVSNVWVIFWCFSWRLPVTGLIMEQSAPVGGHEKARKARAYSRLSAADTSNSINQVS
jgi:hypothetical protein